MRKSSAENVFQSPPSKRDRRRDKSNRSASRGRREQPAHDVQHPLTLTGRLVSLEEKVKSQKSEIKSLKRGLKDAINSVDWLKQKMSKMERLLGTTPF